MHLLLDSFFCVQAYLRDIAGSVPDHHNKASITIKHVQWSFWFYNAYKSCVYTMLQSVKCAIMSFL